jgi:hypothetical protein
MSVTKRCTNTPSMPAAFIHSKCRTTVFSLKDEKSRAGSPPGSVRLVSNSSSSSSSLKSGQRSKVALAAVGVLLLNQCTQRLRGEPSPGQANQPW